MKRRRSPNLTEKTAACLLMLKRGTGEWLIPEPLRSKGTAKEIVSGVEWHHEDYYATGGGTDPRMITPLAPEDHDRRTREIDIPRIAKTKRIQKKQEEFRRKLLSKNNPEDRPKKKWRKKMSGKVVRES